MKVKILFLIFKDIYIHPSDIPRLRAYISSQFKDNLLLHNHLPGGKFNFGYPKIQYRIIQRHPALIAIKEGVNILKEIFLRNEELVINNKIYRINEKEIYLKEYKFGETNEFISYKFYSPWMALNEYNYKKYRLLDTIERQNFLKHLIRENLKTISKGFGYTIKNIEGIRVEGFFKPILVNFKNLKMQCFKGNFTTNFFIPDFIGLGKQSARGFGVVKKDL